MSRLSHESNGCSPRNILFNDNQRFPQIWDETFQRVTDEQEIYEGDKIKSLLLKHLSHVFIFQRFYSNFISFMLWF